LRKLGLALNRRDSVQQQPDFADMRLHLGHHALLEQVDLNQLV